MLRSEDGRPIVPVTALNYCYVFDACFPPVVPPAPDRLAKLDLADTDEVDLQ